MTLQIDDAFIGRWDPEYDKPEIGGDYKEYGTLVTKVAAEMKSIGTISKGTFLKIWKWKGAMRIIRHVRLDEYDSRYAEAFRRAASAPPERKLQALLRNGEKLPGVGAPTGSTIIHFIHPETMPIMDVRTVEALVHARRISTRQRDLEHYEEFRKAIDRIRHECPNWTLRQIDRALFAYHKLILGKKGRHGKRLCQT
ncbi:MAG TPA: hypothetical protein VKO18_03755 [Terriglobia bacterium]|nr:hypothetical protein [Terriglobia bacterium]